MIQKRVSGFTPPWFWRVGWILGVIFLTACLPQGVQVPESPLLRNLERKSGLIALIGTDGNIYTIDQTGANQVQVTTDAQLDSDLGDLQFYQDPTWSPDSQKLAFLSLTSTSGSTNRASVITASSDGQDLTEAFSSPDEFPIYLFWAPNSRQVSFLSTSANSGEMLLQLVSADGGEPQVIDVGQPFFWDWSPDSRRMLVHTGESDEERLSLLTMGREIVERSVGVAPSAFQAPAWSPKGGELLVAAEGQNGRQTLILVDPNGSLIRGVTIFDGVIAFDWSPNGERFAYITGDRPSPIGVLGSLTVVESSDTGEKLTTEEENIVAFFWSPDGEKIAYIEPVVSSVETESGAAGQPVLLLAIYVLDVTTGESKQLLVYRPTQQFVRVLPYFDQYHHSATIWSPDNRYVVLSGYAQPGSEKIWVLPVSGNLPPRVLTDGVLACWSWK